MPAFYFFQWILNEMNQTLKEGRGRHVAYQVLDELVKCDELVVALLSIDLIQLLL
jgi:hypothetical protein